jgi:hypothetical protein
MKFLKFLTILFLVLITVPTFAQDNVTNTISFNDFRFSFASDLASHASITQYLANPEDAFPPQGKHMLFVLSGEAQPDNSLVGIRVYRTADLAEYDHNQKQLTQLQSLLAERRDLTHYAASTENTLPFLPVVAAGQTIRARVAYVGTPNLTGISYITAFQEAAEPLVQGNFLYTFQGVSNNGQFYVSAIFRVNPEALPTELPVDFNYETFSAQLPDYLKNISAQLTAATPDAFAPSLSVLDAVVQSAAFKS